MVLLGLVAYKVALATEVHVAETEALLLGVVQEGVAAFYLELVDELVRQQTPIIILTITAIEVEMEGVEILVERHEGVDVDVDLVEEGVVVAERLQIKIN